MLISRRVGSVNAFKSASLGDHDSLDRASKHVKGSNVSVYKVSTIVEAERIMLLHTAINVSSVDRIEWLAFSEDKILKSGFSLTHGPVPESHPDLHKCHYEISSSSCDLDSIDLVKVILSANFQPNRILKTDAIKKIKHLILTDSDCRKLVKPKWYAKCMNLTN